jgi:hypothetical protein
LILRKIKRTFQVGEWGKTEEEERTSKHHRKKRSNLTGSLIFPENQSQSTLSLAVTDKDLQCGPNSEHFLIIL